MLLKKTKIVTIRANAPWRNEKIKQAKKERRIAERKMRKTKLTIDREIYLAKKRSLHKLIDQAKRDYYAGQVEECAGDQKQLFKLVGGLLHENKEMPLPSHESTEELANRFADFFVEKISKIRQNLESMRESLNAPVITSEKQVPQLSVLEPASEEEIRKLIMSSATKSCKLDPIPTWLLKDCITCLLPIITKIVNISLSLAEVSPNLKEAIVLPLIKKLILDPEILKKF